MTDTVLERVAEAFPVEPVRTLDAIHLATAALLSMELEELTVLSTDHRVRANAGAQGLSVGPESVD